MAKTYYSVLTTYGAQLFAQALTNRQPVQITQFAVGDGNGRAVTPDSTKTALVKQVHRANISAISTDPRNNKQVIFELTIPENIGGFWIREMGVFDSTNRLVAYSNCPDTYKPRLNEGSGKIQVMRMVLLVSSSNAVTLTVDDSVIFATRGQLTPKTITATSQNSVDTNGHTHQIDHASTAQKGIVQLTNDTGLDSEVLALSAKAGKKLSQQVAQHSLALNQKVGLSGNENINGEKTFLALTKVARGIRITQTEALLNAGNYADIYADANTIWFSHKGTTWRFYPDGRITVNYKKIYGENSKPRFADLLETPTTLAGYGITDFQVKSFNGDLNTVRTDGHYCILSASASRNLPLQSSGNLHVITGGAGNERYCHQIFRRHYSKEVYERYQSRGSNDSWSNWVRTDGVDWNDVRNRPTQGTASTNQRGDVLLTNDTGLDSESLALSAKGAKKLSQQIAQNTLGLGEKVGKSGNETISGEKTFNNKLLAFNGLRISYTSALAGQGHYAEMNADANTWWTSFKGHTLRYHADGSLSSDNNKFLMTRPLGTEDLNTVKVIGVYGQAATANATLARHYPVTEAGSLSVTPSAYGVMQIYTTYSTKQMYIRNQTASGWDSNWKRIDGADWSEIRNIPIGSTSSQGLVQSSDSVSSNSSSSVATSKAVKTANDNADGRVSKSGDTMTGVLEIDAASSFIRGKQGSTSKWYVGKGSSGSNDISLYSHIYNYAITLQPDKIQLGKQAFVGDKAVHHSGLPYVQTETDNYGGVSIERTSRNDRMLIESNGNAFAFIRRNRTSGQNHYAIQTPEKSGTVMLREDITSNLSANGWCKLPNGLIFQWGVVTVGQDAKVSVSFPISFPNAVFNISLSQSATSGNTHNVGGNRGRDGEISIGEFTTSSFKVANDHTPSKVNWFAIGR